MLRSLSLSGLMPEKQKCCSLPELQSLGCYYPLYFSEPRWNSKQLKRNTVLEVTYSPYNHWSCHLTVVSAPSTPFGQEALIIEWEEGHIYEVHAFSRKNGVCEMISASWLMLVKSSQTLDQVFMNFAQHYLLLNGKQHLVPIRWHSSKESQCLTFN